MTVHNPELKAAVEKIEAAIQAEREANEERIKEVKKFGEELPETKAKLDNVAKEIGELTKTVNDHAKQIARAGVGGDVEKAKKDVRTAARLFFAAKGDLKPDAEISDDQVAAYEDYAKKFRQAVRNGGDWSADSSIKAAMSVGSDADGGFLAPSEMLSTVQTRLFETSDVRSVATVMTTSRNGVEFPLDVNSGTSGGWVKEKASRSETATPRLGMQSIETHEQYAEPQITQTLLDDAAVNVEAWLAGKIADILGRTENTSFVTGNGQNKPRGFLDYAASSVTADDATRNWGVLQYVPSGASAGFPKVTDGALADNPDSLITLISKLKPAYRANARWFMARSSEASVRKLKDAEGRYLVGFGDLKDGTYGFTLLGHPIHTMEDMPAFNSDTYSIAFGDMRAAYMIVDRIGIRILRDPYTNKPFVKFYTTKRVGGDVVNFDALKLLKMASS